MELLQSEQARGAVAENVVFGLGTNGTFDAAQLTKVIALTQGSTLVVVTSHCPYCSWTPADNAMVHALCTAAQHCWVADFEAAAERHPEWFGSDGVHMLLGGTGAKAYASLVVATLCRAGDC